MNISSKLEHLNICVSRHYHAISSENKFGTKQDLALCQEITQYKQLEMYDLYKDF